MEDLETIIKTLQQRAIRDASAIDPTFAAQVEADRAEITEHEKRLEAQRLAAQQKEEPAEAAQRKELWGKMVESKSTES